MCAHIYTNDLDNNIQNLCKIINTGLKLKILRISKILLLICNSSTNNIEKIKTTK